MGSDLARRARFLDARESDTDGVCVPLASVYSSKGFSAAHDGGSYDCGGVSMIPAQPAALQKITAGHLQRQAMLYVRQSTLHQVLENTESTARQYALRERAIATSMADRAHHHHRSRPGPKRRLQPLIERDFNAWLPRSGWVMWDW